MDLDPRCPSSGAPSLGRSTWYLRWETGFVACFSVGFFLTPPVRDPSGFVAEQNELNTHNLSLFSSDTYDAPEVTDNLEKISACIALPMLLILVEYKAPSRFLQFMLATHQMRAKSKVEQSIGFILMAAKVLEKLMSL